ncbi:MAG TPA: hypothetical protein VIK89_16660 [Cytophagaceae bacterium]
MKYILACLFSLGVMVGAFAQEDTTQQQQEGGMITCMYLDENTIACFSPMEYDMEEQQGGFHYGEPHDSLFEDQSLGDTLQNENDIYSDEGATNNNGQLPESEENQDIYEEPGARLNEDEGALRRPEEESSEPQADQQGVIEEQENYGVPSTESPDNR